MPVNLNYQPTTELMSPIQTLTLKDLAQRSQVQQQETQSRNAISQILQQPGAVQGGQISPQALNAVTQQDPRMGLQLGQMQEQIRLRDLQISEKKQQAALELEKTYVESFDRRLKETGGNRQEAMRLAAQDRLAAIDEKQQSGEAAQLGFNEQDLNRARSQSRDPDQMRAILAGRGIQVGPTAYQKEELALRERQVKVAEDKEKRAATPGGFEGANGELMAALAEKGVSLPAGFRSKSQQLGLLNALRERNPNISADEIAEKVKSGQIDLANVKKAGQIAAGIAGKVAYAENEIEQTIPLVREASANLPRGQFIPYNKLKQMGQEKFSDPNLAEFRMYMTSLSNAYDMLAARGGTDVEKRAEARKNFEMAQSPEALEAVLRAVQKEAKASGRAAAAAMKPPGSDKESESQETKSIGGKTYVKVNGKWFEQ